MNEVQVFERPLGDVPKEHDRQIMRILFSGVIKRLADVVIALLLVILTSPCLFLIALAIKLESPGPVFFIQPRRGVNGTIFRLYKFRSMFSEMTDVNCIKQYEQDDPRVTSVGRFLRRHSLDELPQLFNVLLGQMAIVGPRPHAVGTNINGRLLHQISDRYHTRYIVRPGITGWAQINGSRGTLRTPDDLHRRINYDIYYLENSSFLVDMKIILGTIVCLFKDDAAQ